MDPLAEKYYSMSPYLYCAGNPVNNVDLRGDTITTVINSTITNADGTTSIQSNRYYYGQDANGNYGFIGSNGQLYSGDNAYVNQLTGALNTLRSGTVGNSLVGDLMNSTNTVQIAQGNSNKAASDGSYILWNPSKTDGGPDQYGGLSRPSYIGLGHEMAHIQDTWNGTIDNSTWVNIDGKSIPNSEKYATHVENQLRAEHGIPLRSHYVRTPIGVPNPTKLLRGNTNQSLFYRTYTKIGNKLFPATPYSYQK
jgi:hypothetical protein